VDCRGTRTNQPEGYVWVAKTMFMEVVETGEMSNTLQERIKTTVLLKYSLQNIENGLKQHRLHVLILHSRKISLINSNQNNLTVVC